MGSGKTTGMFFKLVYMAQLQAKSPIDGVRRSRCVIVRSTMPQLRDTTIKSFNYWFKDGQAGKWKATTSDFILRYGDVECEVMFRPLDTPDDVDRVLSLEVTFGIIDEFVQIPREIVEALSARCGRYPPEIDGGATNWGMWGASNPGMEADWWYPMLEDHDLLPPGQESPTRTVHPDGTTTGNWTYFRQPSGFDPGAENLGNLPGKATYYTSLKKGKTKHWIKQFIEVEWGYSMAGKPVFPMFDTRLHVATEPIYANRARTLLVGYDPGKNSAMVLGQYDDSAGRVLILDEIVMENFATDRALAEKLKPLLRTKYLGFNVLIIPDPASSAQSQAVQGSSVVKELRKSFKVHEDTNNQIATRIDPAQYYMMRLTTDGPALLLAPNVIKLKRALVSGYRYTINKDGDSKTDIPDKNSHSHVADAFTYLVRYCRAGEEKSSRKVPTRRPRATSNSYNMR